MNDWMMFLAGFSLAAGIMSLTERNNFRGTMQIVNAIVLVIVRYI